MILRLLRATLRPGAEPDLFRELRERVVARASSIEGLVAFTYGFRRVGDATTYLTLSVWRDFDAIETASRGATTRIIPGTASEKLLAEASIEHYELVDEPAENVVAIDGPVIGLLTGRIRPNAEETAHAMIRSTETEVKAAGVIGLYAGRRLAEGGVDLAVLAIWRDRSSLHRFAQTRDRPTIDPAFARNLTGVRFETFDCLSPDRLMLTPEGPAVLLADDESRIIDASPGFEAVFGVPGEVILRQRFDDLLAADDRPAAVDAWVGLLARGSMSDAFDFARPDGSTASVTVRAEKDLPASGVHALVLDIPGQAPDPRPVDEIVGSVFDIAPRQEVA